MKLTTLLAIIAIPVSAFSQSFNFDAAYQQYPDVPEGLLEAVAWTNTRMVHLQNTDASCIGIPQPYGVMGLHDDGKNYFRENGKKIAKLSGINVAEQKSDPDVQVLAYASAFHEIIVSESLNGTNPTDIKFVLEQLSEIPDSGAVNRFALDLQTCEIFRFMNSSEKAAEFNFPVQNIDVETLYGTQNFQVLTGGRINFTSNGIKNEHGIAYTLASAKSTEYGPAIWDPAPSCNFSSRNGTAISAITIHTVQGTYAGAISWAQNCSSSVSYHYVIRSSDGQVTQLVLEADKAWHVGSENPYTIGYEHEGYVDNPAWYTNAMYNSSADLSRDIVNSGYGIPPLRTYYGLSSAGSDVLGGCTKIKGHQHYPNQTHTDPGINWDWEKYYRLINNNPIINSITASSGNFYDTGGPTGNYQDDERELWLIQPVNALTITLDFTVFNIESGYDNLYIYDGDNIDAPLIGAYTGTNSPGTIVSSGGSLLIEFRSDCATISNGWEATYTSTQPAPIDATPPTTSIVSGNLWNTNDFLVSFTDSDTESGVSNRFYLVAENQLSPDDWYSNGSLGFLNETFEVNDNNWYPVTGTYTLNSGVYFFSDIAEQNSNVYTAVDQSSANSYLYEWNQQITSNDVNQRAGLHFFCDNPNLPNRGNSYFVYLRESNDKVQIYSVDNDVFTLQADIDYTVDANTMYNCKVFYDPSNGDIKVFINNQFVGEWQDPTPLLNGSFVSLRTGGCSAEFDDVRVFRSRSQQVSVTAGPSGEMSIESTGASYSGMISSIVIDSANNISNEASEFYLLDFSDPQIDYLNDGPANDIDTFFTSTLEGNWNAIDVHSGIASYEYAVGSLPNLDDIVSWTSAGLSTTLSEILSAPVYDEMYYISLRAVNNAGLNNVFVSNGQRYMEGLGINENTSVKLLLYPNPANDVITISGLESDFNVAVYDINGKIVLSDSNCKELKVSHLAAGSYNAVFTVGGGFILKRITISH